MQTMKYYYLFVLVQYYLAIRLCDCLPSRRPIADINNNTNTHSSINQHCQRLLTYNELVTILSRNSCSSIENSNEIHHNNSRTRRNIDAGNIDIKALQTTINDNRIMIEYLFNNSINETLLGKALYNHSRIAPKLTSWRDLVDIFCIGSFSILLIYLLICRTGFSLCDQILIFLFSPILTRLQQKQQKQQVHNQQQQQQQQQLHREQQQNKRFTLPTENQTTTSEQISVLTKLADGITTPSMKTKH
jgi:hypothetical protein